MRRETWGASFRQALDVRQRHHIGHTEWTATGLVHHSDAGSQGEFNRSSQHLEQEVRVGTNRSVDGDSDGQAVDALAGHAADPARSGA